MGLFDFKSPLTGTGTGAAGGLSLTGGAPQAVSAFGNIPTFTPTVQNGAFNNAMIAGSKPAAPSPFSTTIAGTPSYNGTPVGVNPTPSGGVTFNPAHAPAATTPQPPVAPTPPAQGLAQYNTSTVQTQNGGNLSVNGAGSPVGYSPAPSYSINTTGSVPSTAITNGGMTGTDVMNTHKGLADYVNALTQSQGYSPQYLQAQQDQYNAQLQAAALGVVGADYGKKSAQINSNFYTGMNLPGDTVDYASGVTARAQAQNTLEQSGNTLAQASNNVNQVGANIALNTAQLARTGNIAAAQSNLQYNPEAVSGENALSSFNSLGTQYAGSNLSPYNQSLTPEQNLSVRQGQIAQSPAYQAGFTSTYQNAQGGTDILNKLSLGALQQNQNGTYSLVNGADAAIGSSNAKIVQDQANIYSNIDSALTSFGKTTASTIAFANQYGLNQSNIPYINQIQNAIKEKGLDPGAVGALKLDVTNLQNDYAAFLTARNGSVAGTNEEASKTIDISTLSPAQMQTIFSQMQNDGQNTKAGALDQIQKATQGLRSNAPASSISSGGGAIGTSWDTLVQ